MPYGDGTGPRGLGPGRGWGRGPCGRGQARRQGGWFGRDSLGFGGAHRAPVSEREAVTDEIRALKTRLAELEKYGAEIKEKGEK